MAFRKLPPLSTDVRFQDACFPPRPDTGKASVYLTCAGREACTTDYKVERHGFAGYGVELVISGQGLVSLGLSNFELVPGSLFVYGPDTFHRISACGKTSMVKFFFDLGGHGARHFLRDCGLRAGSAVRWSAVAEAEMLANLILTEARRASDGASTLLTTGLRLLCLSAREHSAGSPACNQKLQRMIEVRAFIEKNAARLRSLSEITREFSIAPSYLCRLFQKCWGRSPIGFLTDCKMQSAATELASGAKAVKEIAWTYGYADPLHFSRVFRQHFGVSPANFRKQPPCGS